MKQLIMACRLDDLMRYKRNLEYRQEALTKEKAQIDHDIVKLIGSIEDTKSLHSVVKPYLGGFFR